MVTDVCVVAAPNEYSGSYAFISLHEAVSNRVAQDLKEEDEEDERVKKSIMKVRSSPSLCPCSAKAKLYVCGVVRIGPQDVVQMAGGHRVRCRAEEPQREAVAQAAQGPLEGGLGVGLVQLPVKKDRAKL